MQKLAFQPYTLLTKSSKNKRYIFDQIRKKFVVLTPEEWVRQHVVHYLLNEKKSTQVVDQRRKAIYTFRLEKKI